MGGEGVGGGGEYGCLSAPLPAVDFTAHLTDQGNTGVTGQPGEFTEAVTITRMKGYVEKQVAQSLFHCHFAFFQEADLTSFTLICTRYSYPQ